MRNRIMLVSLGALLGAGAFVSGQRLKTRDGQRHAERDLPSATADGPAPGPQSRIIQVQSSAGLDGINDRLDRIEQRLQGQVAASDPPRAEPPASEGAFPKAPEPSERSDDQQQALDHAAGVVESSLRTGVWREEDQRELREAAHALLPGDRFALKMKLTLAANQGKLRDVAPMPFFF
jgi:hypothetical protein